MALKINKDTANVSLSLDLRDQNLDAVQNVVAQILKRTGCEMCGRIAILDIHFGDPDPMLSRIGVASARANVR
jgi:hypothetical protein